MLYHWHTAKNAYPKRASYINFWVPLFVNKKKDNGSLKIAEKSHFNDDYPYKEFKDKKRYGKNALTQLLVSDKYIKKFKNITLKCKTGSLYGMHKNILHSSTLNNSKNCSYVLIFKIWSIAKDLTLSSNIQQKIILKMTVLQRYNFYLNFFKIFSIPEALAIFFFFQNINWCLEILNY